MVMASCDDDFSLLGDDAQPHPPQQQQQQQPNYSSHRFLAKAVGIPLQPRTLPGPGASPSPSPSPTKKGAVAGGCDNAYGEGFHQAEQHSFPDETEAFACDGNDAAASTAKENPQPERKTKQQPAAGAPPSKRRDREDVSDGESPYGLYNSGGKKGRQIQNQMGGGEYRKDREEWSDTAIGSLLDAYTERFEQLNRGNLRGRDWEDVASIVSERCDNKQHKSTGKTVEQCKNKIDNLKKRYKAECQRLSTGAQSVSHWPWFKKMEQIVGNSSSSATASPSSKAGTASNALPSGEDDKSPTPSVSALRQMKRCGTTTGTGNIMANNLRMVSPSNPRWKRVLLKISGNALAGPPPHNVDPKVIMLVAKEIQVASRQGVQVAVVVGGRNIFCSDNWIAATGIERATTYQIGAVASVMNALLLQGSLEKIGVETRVQSSVGMQEEVAEPYVRRRAISHLEKGRVVIFAGVGAALGVGVGVGLALGNPIFSTDAAAALRASEINAEAVLKGTAGESIYSCHTRNSSGGGDGGATVPYEHVSYRELVSRGFAAFDTAAIAFCEENNLPVVLFTVLEPGNISRALCGDQVGTLVDQSARIATS